MKYLFGHEGESALRSLIARPTLYAFDFDGTLAPIVARPDQAHIPTGITRLLEHLCDLAPVAVITGRSHADVVRRLPARVHYVVGNHGAEGLPTDESLRARWFDDCRQWLEALGVLLAEQFPGRGLLVEDKGVSLTVHYRMATDRTRVAEALHSALLRLRPTPRIIGGKCVFNLLPGDAMNKHLALAQLVRHASVERALFAGDDDTDEDVFRDADPAWLTVRIEPRPDSAARYFLHGQKEIGALLLRLIRMLDPNSAATHLAASG